MNHNLGLYLVTGTFSRKFKHTGKLGNAQNMKLSFELVENTTWSNLTLGLNNGMIYSTVKAWKNTIQDR